MTFAVSKHLFSQNFINGTRGPGYMDIHVFTYTNRMDHYICEEQTIS